jgi:hypothetical protein
VNERGSAVIELVMGIGLLVVPVVVLLALVPPLLEARSLARLGAAEAARVIVLGDGSPASHAEASAAARSVAGPDAVVSLCDGTCALVRGSVVEVTVGLTTRRLDVPLIGSLDGVAVSATHREQVDAYRSLP